MYDIKVFADENYDDRMCFDNVILVLGGSWTHTEVPTWQKDNFNNEFSMYLTLLHNFSSQFGRPDIQWFLMLKYLMIVCPLTVPGWFVGGSSGKNKEKAQFQL